MSAIGTLHLKVVHSIANELVTDMRWVRSQALINHQLVVCKITISVPTSIDLDNDITARLPS